MFTQQNEEANKFLWKLINKDLTNDYANTRLYALSDAFKIWKLQCGKGMNATT